MGMVVKGGLVLEGGGMKGIYTAGVLDVLMDEGMQFSHCYGVSAGVCHLASYLSNQKKRAYRISTEYLKDKNYCSFYSLLKTGDMFGADLCYNRIPNELDPYDYKAHKQYPGTGYAVVTNVETGVEEYIPLLEMHRDIWAIQASSSMPLVSKMVENDGKKYLDGGVTDAIPIQKSIADGNHKNLIVMTKEVGYRRKPSSALKLIRIKYKKYPNLVKAMEQRHIRYNATLDFIEKEVAEGRAILLQPQKKYDVGRIEKDKAKLDILYQAGIEDAKAAIPTLKEFFAHCI